MSNPKSPPDESQSDESDPVSDEVRKARDEARCHLVVQTVKDVLWRFDESSEGHYSIYDMLSFLVEDLVAEGCCAACVHESVTAGFEQAGVNPLEHKPDDAAVLH